MIAPKSYSALLMLFVCAILLESALDVIFNWKPFLQFVNLRAEKLVIMILVSALAVSAFGINTVSDLMHTYFAEVPSEMPGVMNMPFWGTTLILGGGSKGIYNLLRKLGYREEMPDATQPSNHG